MTNEELVQRIRDGNLPADNMQSLYVNNLPLIRKFIKPYATYAEFEDILQESYFGLWEAVQHYESSINVRFTTYMEYWIRQSVLRYLYNCGSTIRLPAHIRQKMSRCRKAADQIRQQGREPTTAEISLLTGISEKECRRLKSYAQGVDSLNTPLVEDRSLTLADKLQADSDLENEVIDEIYDEHSKNELWGIVERYTTERENGIIRELFLHDKSVTAVARENGISLDRARQLKENGFRKLKRGKARRELLQKFEIAEAGLFRGGLANFKRHDCSIVEHIAVKEIQAEERYRQLLAEIEEMHRRRLHCS